MIVFVDLKSQFATSSWSGQQKLPYIFTEHGAIMAASVLNSTRAAEISAHAVRVFVRLRELVSTHKGLSRKLDELEHDAGKQNGKILKNFPKLPKIKIMKREQIITNVALW